MIINSWNNYIDSLPDKMRDIFFREEYVKLYENNDDSAECFVYSEKEKLFLLPYLKRRINILNKEYYDFESQYGYGGPLCNTDDINFVRSALNVLQDELRENKVICGFVRFHPIIENNKLIPENTGFFSVCQERKTVDINLNLPVDEIWRTQIHLKHRNVIRKAEKNGLEFHVDRDLKFLKEFRLLYEQRMKCLNADGFYFFNDVFYNKLVENLKGRIFIAYVTYGNKIISAALIFQYGLYGHYHLAGSDQQYWDLYPNNFLIYSAIKYLKGENMEIFNLGGGTNRTPDNSIFKFKRRFSNSVRDFYIGKCILDEPMYKRLLKQSKYYVDPKYSGFFLQHRYVVQEENYKVAI